MCYSWLSANTYSRVHTYVYADYAQVMYGANPDDTWSILLKVVAILDADYEIFGNHTIVMFYLEK